MCVGERRVPKLAAYLVLPLLVLMSSSAWGQLNLGPEELVRAGGFDIDVPGYSVPSFVHWDDDGLKDLVVGEGSSTSDGKIRVYLNTGTISAPQFSTYFFAQSEGSDLIVPPAGWMGAFPLVVYWDADARKDLLVGQADGRIELYLNINTDAEPMFGRGTFLQVGPAGSKTDISVGYRATMAVVDWNADGMKDLVAGATDSMIRLYINEGTDTEPDFDSMRFAQANDSDLIVPGTRSSPVVVDLDGDGKKDLLTGNYYGQLLFYSNAYTDAEPSFSGYSYVESDGVTIDLPGSPRSRPAVCDWTDDGVPDVLIGAGDGVVRLYQGIRMPADFDGDGNVDLDDYAGFVDCLSGPDVEAPTELCREVFDFDSDSDVDMEDFHWFHVEFVE